MMKVDIDYWMKKVRFGQYRGRAVLACMELMDVEYQEQIWSWQNKKQENSFLYYIDLIFEEIEDLGILRYLKKKEFPYDQIGGWLKRKKEAEALYDVAAYLRPLIHTCNTNEEFLNSPYLPKSQTAAKKAFEVFMKSEEDNKEFTAFIKTMKTARRLEVKYHKFVNLIRFMEEDEERCNYIPKKNKEAFIKKLCTERDAKHIQEAIKEGEEFLKLVPLKDFLFGYVKNDKNFTLQILDLLKREARKVGKIK